MSDLVDRVRELLPEAAAHRVVAGDDRLLTLFGPPGTGKTTSMLALVEAHLEAGVDPARLAVLTFTRNAADEALTRIQSRLHLTRDDLPWVRTIHSACFRLLQLNTKQVVGWRDLRRFGEAADYQFTREVDFNPDDPYDSSNLQTWGDFALFADGIRRNRRLGVREFVSQVVQFTTLPDTAAGWGRDSATKFASDYADFKRQSGLYDFTDMLEAVLDSGLRPPATHIWIDEAQDLTPLQWAVADYWSEAATRTFVIGDDDQCQPPGTLVLTDLGPVPIEALDPAAHELVSYDPLRRRPARTRAFRVASRDYRGEMVEVAAGPARTLCTPEHKLLVRVGGRHGPLGVAPAGSLPGNAEVAQLADDGFARWHRPAVTRSEAATRVYSLEVAPFPFYVADGVISHNSIFEWAGADPAALMRRAGHQLVLSHSYRLPAAVHREAERVIGRVGQRMPKSFTPRGPGGSVDVESDWLDVGKREGTALVLGRNRVHLEPVRTMFLKGAVAYRDRVGQSGVPPAGSNVSRAVESLHALRHGGMIDLGDMRNLHRHLWKGLWEKGKRLPQQPLFHLRDLPNIGATLELTTRLMGPHPYGVLRLGHDYRYLTALIAARGIGVLRERPRIEVSTIHRIKGEESDHVYVCTAMTRRTRDEYLHRPDGEHRVYYVAATRARETLTWVSPSHSTGYEV